MRTRRRLQKQPYSRWRRQISLSAAGSIKILEETKNSDLVICMEVAIVDAIRLHIDISRTEALSMILDDVLKIKDGNFGVYQVKVPNAPIVYSVSLIPISDGKKRAEITLNTKVIVFSVDTLSSLIADETLRKALDGQS